MGFDCLKPQGDSREVDIECGGRDLKSPKGKRTNVLGHTKNFATSASTTFTQDINTYTTLRISFTQQFKGNTTHRSLSSAIPTYIRNNSKQDFHRSTHTKNIRRLLQSQYCSKFTTSLDLQPEYSSEAP